MTATAKCEICGEPMPPGETMFKFHGYSGPCPKPPLPKPPVLDPKDARIAELESALAKAQSDLASLVSALESQEGISRLCTEILNEFRSVEHGPQA